MKYADIYSEISVLIKFGNSFMDNVSQIDECLILANETQKALFKAFVLQQKIEKEFSKIEIEFDIFVSEKKATVHKILQNKGVSATQNIIESTFKKIYKDEYLVVKGDYDEIKSLHELIKNIKMALFQRKDFIVETINYIRSKIDSDSCIMKNTDFIKTLKEKL